MRINTRQRSAEADAQPRAEAEAVQLRDNEVITGGLHQDYPGHQREVNDKPVTRRTSTQSNESTKQAQTKKQQRPTVAAPPPRIEAVELLENDIIMGKNKNHPGNARYRKCIEEWASHVGDLTMNIVVKNVEESLAPGRFVRAEDDEFFLQYITKVSTKAVLLVCSVSNMVNHNKGRIQVLYATTVADTIVFLRFSRSISSSSSRPSTAASTKGSSQARISKA